jgi:sensor histidine kinase YesM
VIAIRARRVGNQLQIRVQDDGPGFTKACPQAGLGVGLSNTRARLKQLYGDDAELRTETGGQGGACVTLLLPFRERVDAR